MQEELDYRFQERLGILCGANDPTMEQWEIGMREVEEFKHLYIAGKQQTDT
jgi:hypothetical protein